MYFSTLNTRLVLDVHVKLLLAVVMATTAREILPLVRFKSAGIIDFRFTFEVQFVRARHQHLVETKTNLSLMVI